MREQTNEALRTQAGSESGTPPYANELRPNNHAGENSGPPNQDATIATTTAYDVKGLHDALDGFRDDDLKQIPVVTPGSRLEQGATYIDLKTARPDEFSALGDMVAGEDNWYIPKASVPNTLWNRLIGVRNPDRLDR
jgi:hypothetical protein